MNADLSDMPGCFVLTTLVLTRVPDTRTHSCKNFANSRVRESYRKIDSFLLFLSSFSFCFLLICLKPGAATAKGWNRVKCGPRVKFGRNVHWPERALLRRWNLSISHGTSAHSVNSPSVTCATLSSPTTPLFLADRNSLLFFSSLTHPPTSQGNPPVEGFTPV